jgi:hypothetical protein
VRAAPLNGRRSAAFMWIAYSAVVILLLVIAFELHRIRVLCQTWMDGQETLRRVSELDDEIRAKCPNLFFDHRQGLRDWFRIFERKRKYYEDHKRFSDFESPHSPEESDWTDMYLNPLLSKLDTFPVTSA